MKNLILLLLIFGSLAYSDDLYLKTGYIMKNVQVIDTTANGYIRVQTKEKIRMIPLDQVLGIGISRFDPNRNTEVVPFEGNLPDSLRTVLSRMVNAPQRDSLVSLDSGQYENPYQFNPEVSHEYPNLKFLPISALAIGLAWDYFTQVGDLNDAIDQVNKLKGDPSSLESQRTRKTILGITFTAVAIINTVISLHEIDIKASPNSLSIFYHF